MKYWEMSKSAVKWREGKADLTYDGGGGVEELQLDAAEAH